MENGAEWMCGKRSALHVPTQRAAMTDAACCDGRCTALRHLPENTMVRRAARMGGMHTRIPPSSEGRLWLKAQGTHTGVEPSVSACGEALRLRLR